ncbi:MAG: OmpA family protein [Gemmatimonadaceae bacterium]|nr:OmpA family protein [Gemmatimonadaceae bacterium]
MKKSTVALCVVIVLSMAACGKRMKPLVATPISTAQADSMERARQQAVDDSLRAIRERELERERERERQAALLVAAQEAEAIALITGTVYFEYDQAALSAESRATLDAKIPALQARPAFRVRITGHTDERGSSEYNLALGLRRAAELKAYLVANGIDATRIDISSMGEERPAVAGSAESAWAQNRRAEFVQVTDEP